MSINQLVQELKADNQDFEFYPSTKEMVRVIYDRTKQVGCGDFSVLDIGCGNGNFQKYFDELHREDTSNYGSPYIKGYYVIEKSKRLIAEIVKQGTVIGTDFNATLLMNKKADVYFCNPPYSEYENWATRIINEGNFKRAYLIIPSRWKENSLIQNAIKESKCFVTVLDSTDFYNAERQARAKVDIIEIERPCIQRDVNQDCFNKWFTATFMNCRENKTVEEMEKFKEGSIKHELVNCKTKASMLVDLYNEEISRLFKSFKTVMSLDKEALESIGVDIEKVKEAILYKSKNLKHKYWSLAFEELDEISERLTYKTRKKLCCAFTSLMNIDFTLENMYPVIMWVITHASEYYEEQLINLYDKLTNPDNIINYKSNQKVFRRHEYNPNRFYNRQEVNKYYLNYRIITTHSVSTSFLRGEIDEVNTGVACDGSYSNKMCSFIHDILIVAKNLGFRGDVNFKPVSEFGKKNYVYFENSNRVLIEYKCYKNSNMHIKFDIEFMKALNVEAGRLLGWLHNPEQVKEEFEGDMKGAEKYFKQNYDLLSSNNTALLGLLQ